MARSPFYHFCLVCRKRCHDKLCGRCKEKVKVSVTCPYCGKDREISVKQNSQFPGARCYDCGKKHGLEMQKTIMLNGCVLSQSKKRIYPMGGPSPKMARCAGYAICVFGMDCDVYGLTGCLLMGLEVWPSMEGWSAQGSPHLPNEEQRRMLFEARLAAQGSRSIMDGAIYCG